MMSVPTAVAAALAVVAGFGGEGVVGPYGRTATRMELVVLFREAEAFRPIASRWCGYRIPPEAVYAIGAAESGWRNNSAHCRGGGPGNGRSAGYWSLTYRCVRESAGPLGLPVPAAAESICDWTVAHPSAQARIVLHRLARQLRRYHGDLWAALAAYGPEDRPRDYPADVRAVWIRTFGARSWPAEGRLPRL